MAIPIFRTPLINLYSRDRHRTAQFYSELGFVETFRTPASGEPVHLQLTLDGFTVGIATVEAARERHGIRAEGEGRWIEIVLWTDDTDAALNVLVAKGAPLYLLRTTFWTANCALLGSLIRTATPSNSFNENVETVFLRLSTGRFVRTPLCDREKQLYFGAAAGLATNYEFPTDAFGSLR